MNGPSILLLSFGVLYCIFMYAVGIAVLLQSSSDGEYENNPKLLFKELLITILAPVAIPLMAAYHYYNKQE